MQSASGKHKQRIGELLLDYGLINQDQLAKALDRQVRSGGRLGSVIGEMGYVDDELLLSVLGRQHNLPYVNLFDIKVQPDVLNVLPFEKVKSLRALPFGKSGNTVSLAMVDPYDSSAVRNIETAVGGAVRPFIVSLHQMDKAIRAFEKEGYGSAPFEGGTLRDEKAVAGPGMPGIYSFLKLIPDLGATDLFLTAGAQPAVKINNELKRLSMPKLTSAQIRDFMGEILRKEQMEEFERLKEVSFIFPVTDTGRFRISFYNQRNSISLAARLMHENISSVRWTGLPDWINDYAMTPSGLILIAGLPGSGKAATVASLVDIINSNRRCNIVTLEDPVVYLHRHKLSNVNQREIGVDTDSTESGLRHALRQGADVIAINELRDPGSISTALNAAETGRLVIGAMTALNAVAAVDRVINIFTADQQPLIRTQLAAALLLVFSQKMIPAKEGGRALAFEKLAGSDRVRNLIMEGKTVNIRSLMQVASGDMLSVDRSIARLCLDGKISFEEGLKYADSPSYYQDLIRTGSA